MFIIYTFLMITDQAGIIMDGKFGERFMAAVTYCLTEDLEGVC